jgi:putative tricarboxylic transport membrane protein
LKPHSVIAALLLLCLAAAACAQGWAPQKNVEIVVPNVPGGTNDKLARAIERTFIAGKLVSSTVSVVYKSGGGNQIAYAYVRQHEGDPHYLGIGASTLLTGSITGLSKVTYADFTPIASIFNDYIAHAVNTASAMRGGKDLIARMRTEPQNVTLGFSSSVGNHHHIAAGLFMKAIGATVPDLKTVIFKGSAEALTALLGGHIELVSTGAGNAARHAAAGKLRVLGVAAGQRLPGTLAGVPTWREQGVDLVYGSWRTIIAPKGLTGEQVAFWEQALRKVTESADWKAELERNYWVDYYATGATLRKNLEREYAEMKSILTELGLARQ